MADEIRTEEVVVTDFMETEDANDGFTLKDGLILTGIAAVGYGVGKGIEYTTHKLVPKITSKVTNWKENRKLKKSGKVVEHEGSDKKGSKKPKTNKETETTVEA